MVVRGEFKGTTTPLVESDRESGVQRYRHPIGGERQEAWSSKVPPPHWWRATGSLEFKGTATPLVESDRESGVDRTKSSGVRGAPPGDESHLHLTLPVSR
ncbi:hypothetical protein EYF80_061610 [Liparis tanakae]|uniref:Uncharacterized protein n=1 Tax=Liparis tanakae TaxID=230148 RepID=A0A4Z2EIR9_9TELE|nr:hypothetical protein EYF80_061610 [Liparis tanakae]